MEHPAAAEQNPALLGWSTMSRAARDLAFNNSAAVPSSPAFTAAMTAASAAFRAGAGGTLDVPYGSAERTRVDLFPATEAGAPCLVFIHGGYWQRGGRELVSVLAEGVRAHGWSAAFPGYTLGPDASLSRIVAEVLASIDWLVGNGAAHGIAGPLVVAGHSAGGHLAAMAAAHPAVVAAMPISGVFELGPIRDIYLNEKLSLTDTEVETLSPLRLPVVQRPIAVAYGSAELPALCGESQVLHARRAAAHAPGPLLPVPGADHFDVLDHLRLPDGLLTRALLDLLR